MSSPYRGIGPVEDSEPVPDFGVDRRMWPGLLRHIAVVVVATVALVIFADVKDAAMLLVICGPGIVLAACIALLGEPVGSWLARRRARKLAQGIAELESMVSARE